MMMFNVGVIEEQLYKCMASVKNDRMFYIKVNLVQPLDAACRSDKTIWPNKGRKRGNTATPFNGFVFEEIFSLRIKWLPLDKILEMTLGFFKLLGVYDATIGITVTFVRR